ncbi:hypothetical protein [Salipaludibacillus aurantiacus]|uniref:hypothetical protein n=1 Tax=Salipaludibacillus aurantiacus TaxID=1601833 RepID=UPI0015A71CCE|nr:hypothetical protein [Salipaludibacillus aurantiacus]
MSRYRLLHFIIVLLGMIIILLGRYFESPAVFIVGSIAVISAFLLNEYYNNP